MPRSPQPIPFANWLTSRDSSLRERAETALYHLGPDAGTALFASAERVTRPTDFVGILVTTLIRLALEGTIAWIIVVVFSIRGYGLDIVWAVAIGDPTIAALSRIVSTVRMRRTKLKVLGLALAKRNDLRAIGPLLEAWEPVGAWRRQRPDEDIEHELTRLMPLFLRQKSIDLRTYKKRHLRRKTRRLFTRRMVGRRFVHYADLTDQRADVVVGVLQMLSRSTSEQDRLLLERISRLDTTVSNSAYLREAALFCLEQQSAAQRQVLTVVNEPTPPGVSPVSPHSPGVAVGAPPIIARRS